MYKQEVHFIHFNPEIIKILFFKYKLSFIETHS